MKQQSLEIIAYQSEPNYGKRCKRTQCNSNDSSKEQKLNKENRITYGRTHNNSQYNNNQTTEKGRERERRKLVLLILTDAMYFDMILCMDVE